MFGALLGKKEQHDEKKEEKAEERAMKSEVKKEEKAEEGAEKEQRKEEKAIAKEEKKAPKNDGVVDPAPLDATAVGKDGLVGIFWCKLANQGIASRVLADPVVPVEGEKAEEPLAATTETAPPPTTTEYVASTSAHETPAPKANKRNSIFGGLFGKKEAIPTTAPLTTPERITAANETAPAVPAKDSEPATSFPAVPQQEAAVSESVPAPATTSTTSPVTPDTSKGNRRSSFFSNLGTKKERRTGGVSDAEGTDGEGKKSGGFGGLLRKASRAQGPKSANKTTPTTNGATEAETPAPINKDAPVTEKTANGEVAPESTMTNTAQQTPVPATA